MFQRTSTKAVAAATLITGTLLVSVATAAAFRSSDDTHSGSSERTVTEHSSDRQRSRSDDERGRPASDVTVVPMYRSTGSDVSQMQTSRSYETMYDFLTAVIQDVDAYWTQLFSNADHELPFVQYVWPTTGESYVDACTNGPSNDSSAFYCSADDTIVISQQLAYEVWAGARDRWPSGDMPTGPLGDMAVAFIVAHEYAHNVEHELGYYEIGLPTRSTELGADCMAGAWVAAVQSEGRLDEGDLDEAATVSWLVGSYDDLDPNFHGTPQERVDAVLLGYESNDPSVCVAYLQ